IQRLSIELQAVAESHIWDLVETDLKYEGYALRQNEHNRAVARRGNDTIPVDLDFSQISGLRAETRQKLAAIRPTTLGQAARIAGITPVDVSIIHIWLRKHTLVSVHKDIKNNES
ncbi:MAG TPA: hypothetical protein VGG94_03150, partial [Chthoniobacterales bacterium]